ncbi:P glycoprotein 16 [Aphelenchoides besseyi]|nr:P glycoprotein 16 [Aphelenchoides besseyi]
MKSKKNGNALESPEFQNPEDEEEKKTVEKEEEPPSAFLKVYRYATLTDYVLLGIGVTLCMAQGGFNSVNSIIFRHLVDALIDGQTGWLMHTFDDDKFHQAAMVSIIQYVYYGFIVFTSAFLSISCWHVLCERQIYKIRTRFFRAILRQEVSWFDKHPAGGLTTQLSDGIDRIKDGIGDKLGLTFTLTVQFIGGMTVAFSYSWKMSLVLLAILPVMLTAIGVIGLLTKRFVKREQKCTAEVGSIGEEILNGIRTVLSLNGQEKEGKRYDNALKRAQNAGNKKGLVTAIGIGFIFFLVFFSMGKTQLFDNFAFTFRNCILVRDYAFMYYRSFLVALFSVAQAASQISALIGAGAAAGKIFVVIDRDPEIDSTSSHGDRPSTARGHIEFRDVHFRYPTRPDVEVLKGLSLIADPGKTIAIVGQSGSGKSTIIQLIQRFYDIESGSIRFDGNELRNLNLQFLRENIGVVSQEPCLFACSVAENVRFGNMDLTDEQMRQICQLANAHEFIVKLPNGYETRIGEGGGRVLWQKNPRILLLDEATSALDTESERLVQKALEAASSGRTTIVVAHRLSTIRNANLILVMDSGEVRQSGTHEELISDERGIYAQMVRAQEIEQLKEENDDDAGSDQRIEEAETLKRNIRKRRSRRLSRAISSTSTAPEREAEVDRLTEEATAVDANPASLLTIGMFARKEWPILGIAFVAALARGTVFPIFSIIYGNVFKTLSIGTKEEQLHEALMNLLYFSLLGLFSGITAMIATGLFIRAGESLTRRLRHALFKNILKQDGQYFDHLDHSPGKLSSRLSTDSPNAIDQRLSDVVSAGSAIVAGIIIAFSYGWKMAPIGVFTALFLVILQTAIAQYLKRRGYQDAKLAEEPSRLASEVIDHHLTVKSLGREQTFNELFEQLNERPHRRAITRGVIQALTYALQSSYVFFNFASAYRFGVFLVHRRAVSPYTVFQVIEALNCATLSLVSVATYFPEYVRARLSATIIFKMLQDVPIIQSPNHPDHAKAGDWSEITFSKVDFAYPTNKKHRILRNFDLHIPSGQSVAIVGHSGCGKSTVIQLLLRFYDTDSGTIRIHEADLKQTDLTTHRSHLACVSQEPTLFNISIQENIAYGLDDVSMEKVIDAAKQANCHNFIKQLPQGYSTVVGEKGSRLSGGQKQRIAIARAIIREPKVLLLDEATSALDSESEKFVQEALDKAREGRTCITIAHRLSSIQNSDLIVVVDKESIGTKRDLLLTNPTTRVIIPNINLQYLLTLKMIGIMNVPESPAEFYAAPTRFTSSSISSPQLSNINTNSMAHSNSQKRTSPSIFAKRRLSTVDYLKDGRKMFDGKVVENQSAPQLWSRLLITSFVNKLEDEIPSPSPKTFDQKRLFPMPEIAECTTSTTSLASKSRTQSNTSHSNPKQRSRSVDCLRKFFRS